MGNARSACRRRGTIPPIRFPAPAFRHEPCEPESVLAANASLDVIEAEVVKVLQAGGEAALRLRLARLLNLDRSPEPPSQFPGNAPASA